MTRERWRITLEATHGHNQPPVDVRMRLLLKAALRTYGFRVTQVQDRSDASTATRTAESAKHADSR
jgi:hypothetical protein